MLVADLVEVVDGNFSANSTLTKNLVATKDENAFKEAVPHCVPVKSNVRE